MPTPREDFEKWWVKRNLGRIGDVERYDSGDRELALRAYLAATERAAKIAEREQPGDDADLIRGVRRSIAAAIRGGEGE